MKLFLTSSPCDDIVPADVDLPCIFFEKNSFVEHLQESVPPVIRLTVIAADPESHDLNDEMAKTFSLCFAYHEMPVMSLRLLDSRTEDEAEEIIESSDVIIIGGGHVPTQNAFFQRIGLKVLLQNFDGVVMGISAGSMNCARIVYAQPEMDGESLDPFYRRFIPGLGLTDIMILPHYQKVKDYILDGRRLYEDITFADSMGHCFIAMPDASYILVEDDQAVLFGEGYLVSEGKMEKICEDGEWIEL